VKEDAARYFEWERAVLFDPGLIADGDKLGRKGKLDLRIVAIAIASYGTYGRDCFASSETIGTRLGKSRELIERARKDMIERGWFTVASRRGGHNGRALVLDIAFPAERPEAAEPVEVTAPQTAAVPEVRCWECGAETRRTPAEGPAGFGYMCRDEPLRAASSGVLVGHTLTAASGRKYPMPEAA
jgi:hypothetical protein